MKQANTEELFESIFENAPIGMALVSLEGKWLRVNNSVCEIVGYSEGELLAIDFQQITHPDDLGNDLQFLEDVLAGRREKYQMEKRYFHKNGQIVWIILAVSLIRNADNSPRFFISQIKDITARKIMEFELKAERDRAAHRSRLESLGEMAGGIAHEINNPLTVLSGHSEIILSMVNNDRVRVESLDRSARVIKDTVTRIATIIRGLRNFARDGNNDEYSNFLFAEIIEDINSLTLEQYRREQIEVINNIPKDLLIYGHRTYISQIFINLFNNCFDALKESDSKRWVKLFYRKEEKHHYIYVQDSGPGIPNEVKNNLMEAFFTTKKPGEGTGIGLSICKNIAEKHFGDFYLDESFENTTFALKLPIEG